ncbi:hypothetical protein Btru_063932 [Bulinus truncatus]|nr:hypothetical protein Btru_063932 [Bulinus truncatus]
MNSKADKGRNETLKATQDKKYGAKNLFTTKSQSIALDPQKLISCRPILKITQLPPASLWMSPIYLTLHGVSSERPLSGTYSSADGRRLFKSQIFSYSATTMRVERMSHRHVGWERIVDRRPTLMIPPFVLEI